MTLEEIVEIYFPDYREVMELEYLNINKANYNIPYIPTPEYDSMLEDMVELAGNDKMKFLVRNYLKSELSLINSERTVFSSEFSEHFDFREGKIKNLITKLY